MNKDRDGMVDRRVAQHDANQLELKLAYALDPSRRRHRYGLEAFFFLPRTLGIGPASYPKERFYEDIAAFIRITTPRVALGALGTPGQAERCFEAVSEHIDRLLKGGPERPETLEAARHLKLLGCTMRKALNEACKTMVARFRGFTALELGRRAARAEALSTAVADFLEEAKGALDRLHQVGAPCERAAMQPDVADVWRAVDEYVALVAEEAFTAVLATIDDLRETLEEPLLMNAARDALAAHAVAQFRYRRGRGYPSFVTPGTENEDLPFRRRILKRAISSVLYLDVEPAQSGRLATNLVGMLAAAMAMLFAVLVTLWAQASFELASIAFVSIAVGSYMVKDRIKEWGKRQLGKRVARFLPDRLLQLFDRHTGAPMGVCLEAVSVLRSARGVEAEIMAARQADHPTSVALDGRPETVIRYSKQVHLGASRAWAQHGSAGLSDVLRFDLSRLRARMDAPLEPHNIVDPDSLELVGIDCARVYHVNLVLRFSRGRGSSQITEIERFRVVMDQRGIKRIEAVGGARQSMLSAVVARPAETS